MNKKKKLVEHFYSRADIKAVHEGTIFEEENQLTPEIKERALSSIKEYNKFGKMIYREGNLTELAKTLSEIAKFASRYTVEAASDWFDTVTIKRNMNELSKLSESFHKVAKEAQSHQNRMNSLYEDMGTILNRYFEIEEIVSEPEPTVNEEYMKIGDRAIVDIIKLRNYNPTPSYINKVKNEIVKGKGSVCIHEIDNKTNTIKVSGGDTALFEITVPTNALTKILRGQKLAEAVKFDDLKVKAMAKNDKFLASQLKVMNPEKVFDLYIKGNPDEERIYNKVKGLKESPIFSVAKRLRKK